MVARCCLWTLGEHTESLYGEVADLHQHSLRYWIQAAQQVTRDWEIVKLGGGKYDAWSEWFLVSLDSACTDHGC